MWTISGQNINLISMTAKDIRIDDIAWSLSMQCRYNGHVKKFYSVAEHSYLISKWFADQNRFMEAFQSLFHDAAETYIGDIVRDIKTEFFHDLIYIENDIFSLIFTNLREVPESIVIADDRILKTEIRILNPKIQLYVDKGYDPLPVEIRCYNQSQAFHKFLSMYDYLYNILRSRNELLSFALS